MNPEGMLSLLSDIRRIPEVRLIQIDHANVVSVAQYDDQQLEAIHELLVGEDAGRYVWVNVGVETASGELLRQAGGGAKMRHDGVEPWSDFCARHLRRLCRAKFFPMASLMIGLPGEHDEHLQEPWRGSSRCVTSGWRSFRSSSAPIDGTPPLDPRTLRPLHWALIRTCYRLNFRWVPWFYRDNLAAAGVSSVKRTALQVMGYGQILQWKTLFAWYQWKARP